MTSLGLALPFLLADLLPYFGYTLGYSLTWCVLIGGGLVGLGQALLLSPHVRTAALWIAISIAGWGAAAGVASLAERLTQVGARGLPGALAYLALVGVGGVILGLITGGGLRVLPVRSRAV